MNIKPLILVVYLAMVSGSIFADDYLPGYYGAIKLLHVGQSAKNMDTNNRPGVGTFVSGDERHNFYNASAAAGYQFGNGWRTKGEYVFKKKSEYTSGSTAFANIFNLVQGSVTRLWIISVLIWVTVMWIWAILKVAIPFLLQVAWVLAALVHPSHIVRYAPGDSLVCRLQAT